MKLHSVIISFNRLELTQQAISTYLETVTAPFTLMVVDNGSEPEVMDWLVHEYGYGLLLLGENRYPGYACNRGWDAAPADATHLHRADNDFAFIPGWCAEVERAFEDEKIGHVGLRTDEEELFAQSNVGCNCVITKELCDKGLRYDERPWTDYAPGYSEDSYFSPRVKRCGFQWTRVKTPCILSLASGDLDDPYYQQSYGARRII
jgi:hypothetical protein